MPLLPQQYGGLLAGLPPVTADPNTASSFGDKPPKESLLSNDISKLNALDAMFRGMGTMGQQMMQIGSPWTGIPGGNSDPGLLQAGLLQDQQGQIERQRGAQAKLFEGLDQETGLLAQADPEAFTQGMIGEEFATPAQPRIAKDAEGYQRYVDGPQSGQRAFPGAQSPGPKPPTGMRQNPDNTWSYDPNYLAGQTELRRAGKAETTVNVGPTGINYGDPPTDMAWARNEDGSVALEVDPKTLKKRPIAVPIGGSKLEAKRVGAEEAAKVAQQESAKYADIVTGAIDDVVGIVEGGSVPITGLWSVGQHIPGTPGHNAAALIDTIRANIGFDRLQQMRNASPTGGALGQVSERENILLQSTLGNMALSQSEDQFLRNIKKIRTLYSEIVNTDKHKDREFTAEELGGMTDDQIMRLLNAPE